MLKLHCSLYGGSTLDDHIDVYNVKMLEHAYRDLDEIYDYIANTLLEPGIAM